MVFYFKEYSESVFFHLTIQIGINTEETIEHLENIEEITDEFKDTITFTRRNNVNRLS